MYITYNIQYMGQCCGFILTQISFKASAKYQKQQFLFNCISVHVLQTYITKYMSKYILQKQDIGTNNPSTLRLLNKQNQTSIQHQLHFLLHIDAFARTTPKGYKTGCSSFQCQLYFLLRIDEYCICTTRKRLLLHSATGW